MTLSQPTLETRRRIASMEDYQALYHYSLTDNLAYWKTQSQELHWFYEPHSVFEEHGPGEFVWFAGGRLNVAVNCVDRHVAKDPDKTAIIFKDRKFSYAELNDRATRFGNGIDERFLAVVEGVSRDFVWYTVRYAT